ncbi:MAG: endonuclease MutS2 [Clostridia bacterium]|nr:endonuclease MutS2 [Clostridia bacterium]MBQ9798213.1 endonuclease MutS2 [Clostridia bacterium]
MNFSQKTLSTLEFDKICEMLADCAPTEGARAMAYRLMPSWEITEVLRRQRRTTDAKRLSDVKGMPSFGSVIDVSEACERAVKGAMLNTRELLEIGRVLRSARALTDYIKINKPFDTSLDELFGRLLPNRHLEDMISRSILSEDMIADEASRELAEIRRKIRESNNRIKETLQHYISGSYAKILQDNIVTMRNGRYVLPVKAECKNELKGLIHDTSSSGATIFVEPMAVVDANNELRMLQSREEHEIERILFALSAEVSAASESLRLNYLNITELAFIFACAELSARMRANEPKISGKQTVHLSRARHPLIDPQKVVPTNIDIGGEYDTLIITGPNTGGKTVTLKTVGLFALMTQAGLHIPADADSSICVFSKVLVDIGDEQSIEQSLSTFSSHMVNIVHIMDEVDASSLCLFDELGAGTDPVEGAALAIAVIESVRKVGATCLATTHYTELKTFALDTEGVQNASCEFDVATLKPTYRLMIGTPGKSNAFAISAKLGLQESVINLAKEHVNRDHQRFEEVIEQLEATRLEADRAREEATHLKAEYERLKVNAEKEIKTRFFEAEREIEQNRKKAQQMLDSARLSSEFVFAQLEKAKKAEEAGRLAAELDEARRAVRRTIRESNEAIDPVEEKKDEKYVLPRDLKCGDKVYIVNIDKEGVLLETPDKSGSVLVQAGILKTRTKLSNLQLIEEKPQFISGKQKKPASDFHAKVNRDFRDEIDLRGLLGDEGWQEVDKYLDEAIMANFGRVRLIHGKGTGALKNAIWQHLKHDRRVASFRLGAYGEGDGGVTIVELK